MDNRCIVVCSRIRYNKFRKRKSIRYANSGRMELRDNIQKGGWVGLPNN